MYPPIWLSLFNMAVILVSWVAIDHYNDIPAFNSLKIAVFIGLVVSMGEMLTIRLIM